jgi:hypothetical protein
MTQGFIARVYDIMKSIEILNLIKPEKPNKEKFN